MKIEETFNRLPDKIQMGLIVLCFPVACLFGVLSLAGFFLLMDFLTR